MLPRLSARAALGAVRVLSCIIALLASAVLGAPASAAGTVSGHIAASLAASTERPQPGSSFLIGLRLVPQAGWHSYWSNPGESGLAPEAEWNAPGGLTFGSLRHPAPTMLSVQGITSFVHAGDHVLLTRVQVPATIASGTPLPIEAHVRWLACSTSLCVPGQAVLKLALTAGDGAPGPAAPFLRAAEARLPRAAQGGTFTESNHQIALRLPGNLRLNGARTSFFPDQNEGFDAASAQARTVDGTTKIIASEPRSAPMIMSGVVSDGVNAYRMTFRKAEPASALALPAQPAALSASSDPDRGSARPTSGPAVDESASSDRPSGGGGASPLTALLAALLGGLLLNLMPCVFPVLSLKAVALARAGTSERAARADAVGYAAGSILSCAALGVIIMLLRLGGNEVGWSFQLQTPGITLALALLATAITLNLAGAFELPGLSVSGAPAPAHGAWSSLAAGALTAFVATPCSGPFMAGALGATLAFPPVMSLAIYAALGLGLALPVLLIAFVPRLRRSLPKPGPWMTSFRRWMAAPTGLAALALVWLLERQAGPGALLQGLAMLILFGVGLWWFGWRQRSNRAASWMGLAPVGAAIAGLALVWPAPAAPSAQASAASVQPFSEARLAQLRRTGVPVFVDITADWCLTCKINERVAIDRSETQRAFRAAGVVTLRGDWTNGEPAITRFLASHGRNSIPFYLFYAPGQAPDVLPQLLSAGSLSALAQSTRPGSSGRPPTGVR